MLSIIIPSKNEQFLQKTINDLLQKAAGEVEVIAVLDGVHQEVREDPRVTVIELRESQGMRAAINAGVAISNGKFIMKCDGHCMFDQGFDVKLAADCEENWLVIPRRKRLDAENWKIEETGRPDVDYEYLHLENGEMHGKIWEKRAIERKDILIDDNMTFQGSCWFTTKKNFERIGGLEEKGYGTFIQEPQELGNKVWLSGGRVVINKKTWYAHLHKGKKYGRGYFLNKKEADRGNKYSYDFWVNDRWGKRTRDFKWLMDKFGWKP